MNGLRIILLLLAASIGAHVQAQNEWAKADRQIIRLAPNKFSRLPRSVVSDLEKRGCTIPQSYMWGKRHNVVRGEFKRKGQKDWAVLCSVKRSSAILVYWNSSPKNVTKIGSAKDGDYLTTFSPGKIGFARIIGVADAAYITDHYKAYGGPKPPNITHLGIEDGWAETASQIRYLHRGRWLRLQGAD